MVAEQRTPRLLQIYREQVVPKLNETYGIRNRHDLPRITKIVVNTGVGSFLENQKLRPEVRDTITDTLTKITGQKPIVVPAKRSVSNFKVREGAPSAMMVTLRRQRMWEFLDRLINLAVPRIKDFRGLKDTSFDPHGNYSIGLNEQAVWPEINMANVNVVHGMHVNIVFANSDPHKSYFVLSELGMPFVRREKTEKAGAAG